MHPQKRYPNSNGSPTAGTKGKPSEALEDANRICLCSFMSAENDGPKIDAQRSGGAPQKAHHRRGYWMMPS